MFGKICNQEFKFFGRFIVIGNFKITHSKSIVSTGEVFVLCFGIFNDSKANLNCTIEITLLLFS